MASTSAGGPPPPKQQKLDFGAKQVSGGELKKLVTQYVVEEMLHLNTGDLRAFCKINKQDPYNYQCHAASQNIFLPGEGVCRDEEKS